MTERGGITIEDIYDEVRALAQQVNNFILTQTSATALIQHRLTEAEASIRKIEKARDDDAKEREIERRDRAADAELARRHAISVRWTAAGAVAASVGWPLISFLFHIR